MNINLPFIRRLLMSGGVLLLAGACSSGSASSAWTFFPPQPTGSAEPSGAAGTPCPSGATGSPAASTAAGSPSASSPGSPVASGPAQSPLPTSPGQTAFPTGPAESPVGSAGTGSVGSLAASASGSPSAVTSAAPASAVPSVASSPASSPAPTSAPGAGASAAGSAAPASPVESAAAGQCGATGNVIALDETASLQITKDGQPVSALDVKKGDTVTFQITNTAGFTHDFYIGTSDQLSTDQTTGLPGVPMFASGTQQFTYTVTDATAKLQFACTVPGHYPLMHGTFNVQP